MDCSSLSLSHIIYLDAEKNLTGPFELDKIGHLVFRYDFTHDPVAFLIKQMIERGIQGSRSGDIERSFVVKKILPDLKEKLKNKFYLLNFANEYFKEKNDTDLIMRTFSKLIETKDFDENLEAALIVEEIFSDLKLRQSLNVFNLAQNLENFNQ